MALAQNHIFTMEDIYNLPEGERAELIDGQIYMMAPPSRRHQEIIGSLYRKIADYIDMKRWGYLWNTLRKPRQVTQQLWMSLNVWHQLLQS